MLTPRQLEILQHAVGVDQYGRGKMYRNHFCAGEEDAEICRELVALGYMREWHESYQEAFPYYNCSVTDAGKVVVLTESPTTPKLTRDQRRYRTYLKADTGESFGQWLRDRREVVR